MLTAPPLEELVAIVQHKPDIARRLGSALAHAEATVFTTDEAWETVRLRKRYDAQLVVFDSHDAEGKLNEPVVVDARVISRAGAIRYSAALPEPPGI